MNIQSSPWQPIKQSQTQLLPAKPNHPFFYKWHPANWQFQYFDIEETTGSGKSQKTQTVSKGFFVPHIRMERIVPGVNGIHQIEKEIGNPASRIGKLQQEGWIYLNPNQHDYMKMYPVRGGRYHVPKWLDVNVIAGRLITKMDLAAKNKWSVGLLLNGVLPKAESHFWELMIIDYKKRPDRFIKSQHIPEIKKKIDKEYAIIEDMKQALGDYQEKGLETYKVLFK